MPEEKRKINAWIPQSLYNKLENSGHENITQALIKAIESFLEDTQEDTTGYKQDIAGYLQDIEGYKQDLSRIQKDIDKQNQDISGYKQDIVRLKEDLDKRPDLVEFVQLQARFEGLQEIIRQKDEMIYILKQTNETLNTFAHYFKSIEVKQLPGSTEERPTPIKKKPASKKSLDSEPENKPEVKQEEKICKNCLQAFLTANPKKETCSDKCRSAYSRKMRTDSIV